jgi:hypothetical protein
MLIDAYADVYGFPSCKLERRLLSGGEVELSQKLGSIIDSLRTFEIDDLLDAISFISALPVAGGGNIQTVAPIVPSTAEDTMWKQWNLAASHGRSSKQHKVLENLHLMAFAVGAFSPVRCYLLTVLSPLTIHVRISF